MSYFERAKIEASDSPSVDSAGRWRVSNPYTWFDGVQGVHDPYKYSTTTTGSGASATFNATRASTNLTTTANTAGSALKQSLGKFKYIPGKPQQVQLSFVMGSATGGNIKRVGLFDDRNGLFLQQNGSEVSVVRRTFTSGNTVDNKTVQSAWNLDPLDGTGASGVTVDLTKIQLLFIDFQWLGAGRVRFGFYIDGSIIYFHEINTTNTLDIAYVQTPSLPVRFSIENDGTGDAATLQMVCATVLGEGAAEPLGTPGGQIVDLGALTSGTAYAAFGIKAGGEFVPPIRLTDFELLGTSVNDYFAWYLMLNPTVSGTFTYTGPSNSNVSFATGNGSQTVNTTAGRFLLSGLGASQTHVDIPLDDDLRLPVEADGTPIPWVLVVIPLTNMSMYCAFNWREYS